MKKLPQQFGVPGMPWPQQQQMSTLPEMNGGAWPGMPGQMLAPQYGGWPPLQQPLTAQWGQQQMWSPQTVQY